jgi:hypothetical protein
LRRASFDGGIKAAVSKVLSATWQQGSISAVSASRSGTVIAF